RIRNRRPAAARQPRDDRVEQIAGAVAVSRRERKRIAQSEPVELERQCVLIGIVNLVRDQHYRLVCRPQDLGELLVAGRNAGACAFRPLSSAVSTAAIVRQPRSASAARIPSTSAAVVKALSYTTSTLAFLR